MPGRNRRNSVSLYAVRPCACALLSIGIAVSGCEGPPPLRLQPVTAGGEALEEELHLPRATGTWRFVGWRLTGTAQAPNVLWGSLQLDTQRFDSIGGLYVDADSARWRVSGEVRRDATVAMVAWRPDGAVVVLAGDIRRDTLWIRLTTWPTATPWPAGTAAAFVRAGPSGPPFRRPTAETVTTPVVTPPRATIGAPAPVGPPRPLERAAPSRPPRVRPPAPPGRDTLRPRDTARPPTPPVDTTPPRRDTARPPGQQPPSPLPPPPPRPDTGRPPARR